MEGNPFETLSVLLLAQGIEETISFSSERIQDGILTVKDLYIGVEKTIVFSLVNRTNDSIKFLFQGNGKENFLFRFRWKDLCPKWTIFPLEGSLEAQSQSPVALSFYSEQALELNEDLTLETEFDKTMYEKHLKVISKHAFHDSMAK